MNAAALAANPFPGLRPFLEREEELFFGRETQVDDLVDTLGRTRFLAVIGSSGSGKSSLVNCGLVPALHRGLLAGATGWRIARMRPGSRPLRELANGLCDPAAVGGPAPGASGFSPADLVEATLRMSRMGLVDVVEQARLPAGASVLVIVDQFEELFRFRSLAAVSGSPAARQAATDEAIAFVDVLLQAVKPDVAPAGVPIHVALSMRSDFLGDCAQYQGLPEAINRGQYLVPRMTRDERRAAIAGPIGVREAGIDPVLLTRLVNDVGDNPDQLSILQHALNRTWAAWAAEGGQGPLALRHYEAIGTMTEALNQHAEEVYGRLRDAEQRRIAAALFSAITDAVTDPRGTRRPTRFDTLREIIGADAAALAAVIDTFRDPTCAFVMPPAGTPLHDDTPIDISHESLMRVWDRLRAWADNEAQEARTYQHTAETAALYAKQGAGLLGQPDLQRVLQWRARVNPRPAWAARYGGDLKATLDFVRESEQAWLAAQRRQARNSRLMIGGGLLSIVVLIGVVAVMVHLNAEAKQAKALAEENLQVARDATTRVAEALDTSARSQEEASQARAELATTLNLLRQQPGFEGLLARATQVSPDIGARVATAVANTSRVYIHYADEDHRAFAERLRVRLAKEGYVSPAIEKVDVADAPPHPELRYFRESDAGDAKSVQDLAARMRLGPPAIKLVPGFEAKAAQRQVEVWLPRPRDAEWRRLIDQASSPTASADEQGRATRQLVDGYAASPDAIAAAADKLAWKDLADGARVHVLSYLARTAPIAWDPPVVARCRPVLENLVVADGAQPDVERLRKVLDRASAGS